MSEKKYPITWEYKSHSYQIADTGDYDGYWEVTNGKDSLIIKEDYEDIEKDLQAVVDLLNNTYANFTFDRGNEAALDAENKWLKSELEQLKARTGSVWVKASEFAYVAGDPYHAKDDKSKGAGCFDAAGNFTWGDGSITPHHEQDDLFILDEPPAEQPVSDELEHLRRWKKEALLIINPIMEYAQGHKDAKLGSSLTEFVIDRCKELDRMKAVQPVMPTFWDVAKAFKWAAEHENSDDERLVLTEDGQWMLFGRDGDVTATEDLTPGNVAELYCLQNGFEKDEQPVREVDARDFAEWLRLNWKASQNGWVDALGKWETTHGLYNLFKEQQPPAEWSGKKGGAGKDANETGRVFINKILLLAAGFEELNKDDYEFFVKDKVEVWDFNGEYWIVDMLDQAGIEKQFQYMDELETLFHSFGLSFYNQQEQQ